MTWFANKPGTLSLTLLFPAGLLLLIPRRESGTPLPSGNRSSSPNRQDTSSTTTPDSLIPPLPAITTYRAHMLLMTILGILAVDFPLFPRTLAKCETYGVSLVGSSCIARFPVAHQIKDGPWSWVFCIFPRSSFSYPIAERPILPYGAYDAKDVVRYTQIAPHNFPRLS
jgi:hypothetical protein